MGIPKSALSYEVEYHELRELLGSIHAPDKMELPFETQAEMRHFRMRWYAFQRTCLAEQERIQEKALKMGDTARHAESRTHEKITLQCKRFEVIELGENEFGKWVLKVASRDGKYPAASAQISALVAEARNRSETLQREIASIKPISKHDEALNNFLLGTSLNPLPPTTPQATPPTPPSTSQDQPATPADPTYADLGDIYKPD